MWGAEHMGGYMQRHFNGMRTSLRKQRLMSARRIRCFIRAAETVLTDSMHSGFAKSLRKFSKHSPHLLRSLKLLESEAQQTGVEVSREGSSAYDSISRAAMVNFSEANTWYS